MKKVYIQTNMDEVCGNAQYARDLQQQLANYYVVKRGEVPLAESDADVVIINWQPARVVLSYELVKAYRDRGQVVIVIWQNSVSEVWEAGYALRAASAVTAHEPMAVSNLKVVYIPMGVHDVALPRYKSNGQAVIGSAGFPFAWKRYDFVAEVARRLNVKCRMVLPFYEGEDEGYVTGIEKQLGSLAEIHREWMTVEGVIQVLATNTVNLFLYNDTMPGAREGQSASVRMGIAAKRPLVLSTSGKFRTLYDYPDELYFTPTLDEACKATQDILDNLSTARHPKRILDDMNWEKVGTLYRDLIERLVA